jgi:hypothetical protein
MPAMPPPTTTTRLPVKPVLASAIRVLLRLVVEASSSAQPVSGNKPAAMPPAAQPMTRRRDMAFLIRWLFIVFFLA